MPPTLKKPRFWLLSVASAAALLPGCAEEHDTAGDDPSDRKEDTKVDIGLTVIPDGGQPVPDAGHLLGVVVNPPDAGLVAYPDSGPVPGVIVAPERPVGTVALPDAGATDAGVADGSAGDAAAKDAGCPIPVFINGIIVAPPDASCIMPPYPGIMPRNVDGD